MTIVINSLDQLENMINVMSSNQGRLDFYAQKKIERDSQIDTISAILKKCRSMIADIDKTESSEEAIGWVHGAIIKLEKSKCEF